MTRHILIAIYIMLAGLISASCRTANSTSSAIDNDSIQLLFNADSAYAYVQRQCDFGARVPGTESHRRCADYFVEFFNAHGANVIEQKLPATTFDGTRLTVRNIIAEYNPDAEKRILLLAHYDSRPWADNDPDETKHKTPVMAANDGASGVGVLMELARLMHANTPNVGVDILLVDLEDWGETNDEDSWAIGTRLWAENPHRKAYQPLFGILLDMVGAGGARFAKEYYSMEHAAGIVNMVWSEAQKTGNGKFFVDKYGGAITDDHLQVIKAGIPCIDIIDYRPNGDTGFFSDWHTTHDTMKNIDRKTLSAVGQTLEHIIFSF